MSGFNQESEKATNFSKPCKVCLLILKFASTNEPPLLYTFSAWKGWLGLSSVVNRWSFLLGMDS